MVVLGLTSCFIISQVEVWANPMHCHTEQTTDQGKVTITTLHSCCRHSSTFMCSQCHTLTGCVSRCAGSLVPNQAVSGCSGRAQDFTINPPLTDTINVSLLITTRYMKMKWYLYMKSSFDFREWLRWGLFPVGIRLWAINLVILLLLVNKLIYV
jgi:hypothetical protein